MKRRIVDGLRFMVYGCLCAVHGILVTPEAIRAETVDRIVAVVNGDVVTDGDVMLHLELLAEEQDPAAEREALFPAQRYRLVLERLIEQRLILQEAEQLGVTVGPDEVAKQLDTVRRRAGSEEAFRRSLDEAGLIAEELKHQLREQLVARKTVEAAVRSKVTVSPQEVAEELVRHPEAASAGERVEVSHIVVRVGPERSAEAARARITDISQSLRNGADFSEQARRSSEDPQAAQGGALGWVTRGTLMPELDTVVFSLREGEVSAPIQTRLGFHLVKVGARQTAPELSVADARRAVEQDLYRRKFQEALRQWLSELKRRAYIEIREGR